mgnify:CR=1 FL=1
MVANIANTNLTNTFDYWRNRTNECADVLSSIVVTCDSNTTPGNAHITGTMWSNGVCIGNSSVNTTIYSPTNAQKASGDYFLNADGSWVLSPTITSNGTIIGGANAVIDEFPMTDFAGAEYFVVIKDPATTSYLSTKIVLIHDDIAVYMTEYATLWNKTQFATFDAVKNGTNIQLLARTNAATFNYKLSRNAL